MQVFRYDLKEKRSLPPIPRLTNEKYNNPTVLMVNDQVFCVGSGAENYSQISFETATVRGQTFPIKLHWFDTDHRTVWLRDSPWERQSNVTLPRGTKLVVREKLYWGGLHQNNLYLESPATRFVGKGLLIELPKDTPLFQPDPEFQCYEAIRFQQLDSLYQHAVHYEPSEIPALGSNDLEFKPDPKPYDFDISFDRDYMMFLISHASQEQLNSHAYRGPLAMFGISFQPPEERVFAK